MLAYLYNIQGLGCDTCKKNSSDYLDSQNKHKRLIRDKHFPKFDAK